MSIDKRNIKKFSYLGQNEYGKAIGINLFMTKQGIFIIIHRGSMNKKIPLSTKLPEKYELIKRIFFVMTNREEQYLNCIINKIKRNLYIRNYPVFLSYLNDQYILSIQLPDSTFQFPVHNIDELLSSLKEGMIFPGDKFIGLEAIELLDYRKEYWYWKAKCLLCSKETEIRWDNLKRCKSCGCLIGRNFDSEHERFMSHVDKQENIPEDKQIRGTLTDLSLGPCHLYIGCKDKDGYGEFIVKRTKTRAHRYSLENFLGRKLLPGKYACHKCNNRSCCNPNHLYEGTPQDNMDDRVSSGSRLFGEAHPSSKITNQEVSEIRERLTNGEKQTYLAKEYGVSQSAISSIKLRITRKDYI